MHLAHLTACCQSCTMDKISSCHAIISSNQMKIVCSILVTLECGINVAPWINVATGRLHLAHLTACCQSCTMDKISSCHAIKSWKISSKNEDGIGVLKNRNVVSSRPVYYSMHLAHLTACCQSSTMDKISSCHAIKSSWVFELDFFSWFLSNFFFEFI